VKRRLTKEIFVGSVKVGGCAPIVVQSMTNTDTRNVEATVKQIYRLEEAGCEIVRIAVPTMEAARRIKEIKPQIHIPLVADVHFDYRIGLAAIDAGCDALRINPGNIGGKNKIKVLTSKAREHKIPIRIGVNSGSLEKRILKKYGNVNAQALVESASESIKILEDLNFHDIKVSIKAADVLTTIDAYRLLSQEVDYPLHIGITEAGPLYPGTVKSAVGIGILLYQGIGDTIRVSLTRDPVDEIRVAYEILKALKLRVHGPDIISCPTCGRCEIDLITMVEEAEKRLLSIKSPLKVAIMGCVVNGPGEAKEADVGIAGGKGFGILFKKGKIVRKVEEKNLVSVLLGEVEKMSKGRGV